MTTDQLPTVIPSPGHLLTAAAFQKLADVPPEVEWFANLGNKVTRRAYENALGDFMRFVGLASTTEFRTVTRARHRLARRPAAAVLKQPDHPAPLGRAVVIVRVPVRAQRRDP